jgi:hypothetical protein
MLRSVPLPDTPRKRAAAPLPERDRSNSLDSLDGLTGFARCVAALRCPRSC